MWLFLKEKVTGRWWLRRKVIVDLLYRIIFPEPGQALFAPDDRAQD
jgi:hypothetical protein